jgi:transcriptional regulator with XRE-family HTH domain
VTHIRALRRSHGLTLIDLALLTDIPARTLAQIEYGFQRFDYESRTRLARVFDVRPDLLLAGNFPAPAAVALRPAWHNGATPVLVATLAATLLLSTPLLERQLASVASRSNAPAAANHAQAAPQQPARITPSPASANRGIALAASPTSAPTATVILPTPTLPAPTPRFTLLQDGPHGCPLAPLAGRIVLTQGYGVGTHEPANVWGAVDLAIDGDGDGFAEPDTTVGITVVATQGGVAHVYMGSWPGGNFVRVVNEQTGWSTAYAHLDTVAVADGGDIPDGATIGTVGLFSYTHLTLPTIA